MAHTFTNIGFETAGTNAWDAAGWTLSSAGSFEEFAGFDSALVEQPVEDYVGGWSSNENFLFAFVGYGTDLSTATFNLGPQQSEYEPYEREWSSNESFVFEFTESILDLAPFDSGTPEDFEDFEDEWSSNDTASVRRFESAQAAVVFWEITPAGGGSVTIRITSPKDGGVSESYSASGATYAAMIAALTADIDANSVLVDAVDTAPVLSLVPLDTRQLFDVEVVEQSTGMSVLIVASNVPTSIDMAPFDSGTPEDFEDYEDEWKSNDTVFSRHNVWPGCWILQATAGTYTVIFGLEAPVTYVATGGDTPTTIANGLASGLAAKASIATVSVYTIPGPHVSIEIIPVDKRRDDHTIQVSHTVDTDSNIALGTASNASSLDFAEFDSGGSGHDYEDYESTGDSQIGIQVVSKINGTYSITANGFVAAYTATAPDTTATICTALFNAVNNLSPEAKVEAVNKGTTTFQMRSTAEPHVEFGVAVDHDVSPPAITTLFVDPSALWTWLAFMWTI